VVLLEHLQYFQLSHPLEAVVVVNGTQIHLQHLKQEMMEDLVVADHLTLLQAEFQEDQETRLQRHHLKVKMEEVETLIQHPTTVHRVAMAEELLQMALATQRELLQIGHQQPWEKQIQDQEAKPLEAVALVVVLAVSLVE
jgi:hypothetical protein